MLFDQDLSAEQWEEAIDGMLATVATNYVKHPNDQLSTEIAQLGAPVNMLYVAYNQELAVWELHSDQSMFALQRGKSSQAEE